MLSHKESNSALRARLLAGHTPNTRLTRQRTGSTQLPTSASPPAHACSRQAVTPRAPRAALEPATHGPGQARKQLREGFPQMWHPRPCCPYPPPTCPEQEHCCENRRLLPPHTHTLESLSNNTVYPYYRWCSLSHFYSSLFCFLK